MKPLRTSKAKTAAELAEDRLVFDKPITLQQYSSTTHTWSDAEHIHANINKAISAGGQSPSDSAHISRYIMRMRYFAALETVRQSLQRYRITYNGENYELTDYDDYNESRRVIKITASRIRTGTITLIADSFSYDEIGQQISTETETALPCTEYEITQEERADFSQISLHPIFRLRVFRDEYNGERRAEYDGERYRIGSVRYVGECADLYLVQRIGELDGD